MEYELVNLQNDLERKKKREEIQEAKEREVRDLLKFEPKVK